MFTVALIGPDGAGKTTIGKRLEQTLPVPVKYYYMGVNPDAINVALPTTRLINALKRAMGAPPDKAGPPDPMRIRGPRQGLVKRSLYGIKSILSLVNRLSEEWFRQGLAWYYQRRGNIVVFDRHFFLDYYAYDVVGNRGEQSLARRIHGFILLHAYPRPDLVLYLDAPAEVLFARKGEGTLEALERRRQDYLQMREHVPHFVVVDATQPIDDVVHTVSQAIMDYHQAAVRRKERR